MRETPDNVLVVDDDAAVTTVLCALLRQNGIEPHAVSSGAEALEVLRARPFAAVITDLRMDGMSGLELLAQVVERWPEVPIIMLTAHASIPLAVDAMRLGALDFVQKPFDREEIVFVVRKALALSERQRHAAPAPPPADGIVGESPALGEVLALIERAAPSNATVLLMGETGTGKELFARMLHERSGRSGPLVTVHCAALPENLLESELFGYEKGAFTGASTRKPGRVELAEGGTLFLDEVGEIPQSIQVKLLRLLQGREYERLGGRETLHADVRFVAATHRDLQAMVAADQFREDLFYRLAVLPVWVPPLRERTQDIAPLASHFCVFHGRANGKPGATLEPAALALLVAQAWPGNVRQLENFVERLVVLSDGERLGAKDVERELARGPTGVVGDATESPVAGELQTRVQEAEGEAIRAALARAGGNRTVAARILGVSRRTLYYKLREHGLLD